VIILFLGQLGLRAWPRDLWEVKGCGIQLHRDETSTQGLEGWDENDPKCPGVRLGGDSWDLLGFAGLS
jgi:hypothetical protein